MKNVYASIDIGSVAIKIVVCELYNNKLNLLATSSVKSRGIKKGLIINAEEAKETIMEALNDIEKMLGIKIRKIIASIPANNATFTLIKGESEITSDSRIVTSCDVVNTLQDAISKKQSKLLEVVTVIPIDFKLDERIHITNPLKQKGKKLEAKAILVEAPKKNIKSVLTVLKSCGLEVVDIVINSIGVMSALSNDDTKSKIGSIINIGAETTNVSIYNKGVLISNSILNVGGSLIDDFISSTYKISKDQAIRLKTRFIVSNPKYASRNEFMEVETKYLKKLKINQLEISKQVSKKYLEILELSIKDLNNNASKNLDYIMFTGGVTNAFHFDTLIKDKLGKIASVAKVKIVGLRNNQNSSSVGNIIFYINKMKLKGQITSMISSEDHEDLSSVKKNTANISSDSMLNNVVSYFFGE